jgi:intein/homing endonuclease
MAFKNPKGSYTHVIGDSREAWVESVAALFRAYKLGTPKPKYVYDEIRPEGLPIKGFGGISTGSGPLKYLHNQLEENIELYMTDKYYDSVIFKADCANQIGCMVVSGNVRRCLPGGVWISTTDGLIKIKDLEPYHRVQTLNGYKGIKNIFKQGTQKLISVILENEREFRCTPNHKFAVLESIHGDIEWIEAQYLDENDYVLLSHIPCDGNNHYDIEAAYFYGVLNGDGHVRYNPAGGTQTTICFSNDEIGNKSCNKIINYLNSVGVNYHERFSTNSTKYYHLVIYGSELAKTCLPYKTPKKSPIIPEAIYSASPKARAAYLAGLCDADGTASEYNLCSSKWKLFLQQVQIIASSLGIDTYIHTRPERILKATGKTYARENLLIIKGFASKRQACKLINPYMCKQFPRRDSTKYDNNIPFGFLEKALKERKLFQEEYNDLSIQCRRKNGVSNLIHKQLIDFYPEFWEKVIPCRVQQVIDFEEEEETYDIEVEEDHCFFAEGILVHNSAELACLSINDPVFKDLKNYNKYPRRTEWGWMSNNSSMLEYDEDFEQIPIIAQANRDRHDLGFLNLRNFPKGRIGKKDKVKKDRARGVNACITGDTKVCVADGRGFLSINELIDEDVDVYCIDDKDEVCIRRMRNPRITGYNQKILRVVFDNGDYIRVTENHKFMLRDRSFVEARNLKEGNRLAVLRRYSPEKCNGNSYWDKYISINYSGRCIGEHRLIAENKYTYIGEDDVHHIDENRLNNNPDNLELKENSIHLSDHSIAEENANWSGYSNQDLINLGVDLATRLKRRFSVNEWKALGFVQLTSEYRRNGLGSFEEFAYMCADIAGVVNNPLDTRTLRFYLDMIDQGYDAEIINKNVYVIKICEGCKKYFQIVANRREVACCSLSCNNTIRDYSKNIESNRKINSQKKEFLKEKQLEIYCELKNRLGRIPLKPEWIQSCKEARISYENTNRPSSPFRSWNELKWNATYHNHRVLAVYEDGEENVYNGTVDEFHNLIIGGWESYTPFGRKVEVGIVSPQCGEQLQENKETCIIGETFPTVCNDLEKWLKACEYTTLYNSTVTLLPTHQPATNKVVARNRRIGVGLVDFTGWVNDIGMTKVIKSLRKGYKHIRKINREVNAEAGVPESIRVTTVKPGGTVPKLAGRTSGSMYPNFHFMLRRMRIARNSPIHQLLTDANVPYENDLVSANTDVFEFPVKMNINVPQSEDISVWQQAMNLVILQREWSDNSVSNTLNFRPKWVLIKHLQEGDIEEELRKEAHKLGYGPYYNTVDKDLNSKDSWEDSRHKISVKWNQSFDCMIEAKIYKFDPRHEEDALEAVLASIAPVTKTVSLLSHTAKGVYPQMPEEGITEEEYHQRLSLIKKIDWSKLKGSEGLDERYCSGESCERV